MSLSARMEPIRKTPRGPPVGYVIDNHRYITVAEGTRIIGTDLICKKTLWNYAKAGHDPASGVDLGVIRFPLLRTGHQAARSDKEFRYLVREDRVLILRDILRDFRTHRKGSLSDATLADMRDAAVSRVRATRRLFSPTV